MEIATADWGCGDRLIRCPSSYPLCSIVLSAGCFRLEPRELAGVYAALLSRGKAIYHFCHDVILTLTDRHPDSKHNERSQQSSLHQLHVDKRTGR